MRMMSYAQNGEDILLDRLFLRGEPGLYIDVGANDPVWNSVTKHFYELGWSGINIEPEKQAFARLSDDRPRDINLNAGISDRDGTLTFYEAPSASGWSTFSPAQAENLRREGVSLVEKTVPVTTLAAVCAQHVDRTIDFLKIDAESHEREVLSGADWSRWRPRAVLVETNGFEMWEPILLGAGYVFAAFDGINRFYLRDEDRHLLPRLMAPVNASDDYVPYWHHAEVTSLRARLADYEGLGPSTLAFARRVKRTATRFPRLASVCKRLLRPAG